MSASAKHLESSKWFRKRSVSGPGQDNKQRRFFGTRGWEITCGDYFQTDDAPDRLVFVVSLIILPFMLII
jgi:hypothetical protein